MAQEELSADPPAIALAVIREQLKAIPRIETSLAQLVQLERSMAEIVVKSDGQGKQLNAMWAKVDEIGKWHSSHDTAAAERLAKLTDYVDARIADVRQEIGTVSEVALAANTKVDGVINQAKGAGRAFAIGCALFGGLVMAMVVWVVSETHDTGRRVAVLENRADMREAQRAK